MKRLSIVSLTLAAAAVASAQLTLLSSRSYPRFNDLLDWGQLGSDFSTVSNFSVATSNFGIHAQVSFPNGDTLVRLNEGNGWAGNFKLGDHLILLDNDEQGNSHYSDVLTVHLDQTTNAIGAQIMANPYGYFEATIYAYDGLGNFLGSVTDYNGHSNGNEDNSATFIGVASTRANISYIGIQTWSLSGNQYFPGFAINQLSLANCSPTPEPGAFAALGIGLVGLLALRRRTV